MRMTDTHRGVLLLLADVYLRLGRARRAMMLLAPLRDAAADDVELCRLALRGWLALGDHRRALDCIDRLVEHEFSSPDLAFALSMQARALFGLGRGDAARSAWAECVALCRASGMDVTEYAR